MAKRTIGLIDGFNLYHALDDLKDDSLKWLDLHQLCLQYAPKPQFDLIDVYYFTAYATWRPGAYKRHRTCMFKGWQRSV